MNNPCGECIVFVMCDQLCDQAILEHNGKASKQALIVLERQLERINLSPSTSHANEWVQLGKTLNRLSKRGRR